MGITLQSKQGAEQRTYPVQQFINNKLEAGLVSPYQVSLSTLERCLHLALAMRPRLAISKGPRPCLARDSTISQPEIPLFPWPGVLKSAWPIVLVPSRSKTSVTT
jgi:hypothetical protein